MYVPAAIASYRILAVPNKGGDNVTIAGAGTRVINGGGKVGWLAAPQGNRSTAAG